jgi:transcriptional regulator with GAF, ATPase, and Fis domain
VTLNCAAVPAELIESELFGHEKGAFTGAAARHLGKFEQAHRGTLFLDEIGDMPLGMQAKLLRVLEDGELERVGGDKAVTVDARVLVATHRNLDELVREGKFRQDLYHRVYVFPLSLPPLRERYDDIPALPGHFARHITEQNGWKPKPFSAKAIEELRRYHWPGNVRELRRRRASAAAERRGDRRRSRVLGAACVHRRTIDCGPLRRRARPRAKPPVQEVPATRSAGDAETRPRLTPASPGAERRSGQIHWAAVMSRRVPARRSFQNKRRPSRQRRSRFLRFRIATPIGFSANNAPNDHG